MAPRITPTRSAHATARPRLCQRASSSWSSERPGSGRAETDDPEGQGTTARVRSTPCAAPFSLTDNDPTPQPGPEWAGCVCRTTADAAPRASTASPLSSRRASRARESSERSAVSTTVSGAVAAATPANRRRSAAIVGPKNGTSARPRPNSSATTATSTADAQGPPSSDAVRSSRQPEAVTAASSLTTRSVSSRSVTRRGPSRSSTWTAESRRATCSGESRTSTSDHSRR